MGNRGFSAAVLSAKSHQVAQANLLWMQEGRAKNRENLGVEFNSRLNLMDFCGIFSCDEGDFQVVEKIHYHS